MKISVAICDDLKEERQRMFRMLESYSRRRGVEFYVEMFQSGEELLRAMQPDRWDIMLLDIYLPGMTGIEAARRLRAHDENCILILVTTSREHGMESYDLRTFDYLVKPVRQRKIDASLDWCLREYGDRFQTVMVRSEWEDVELLLRDVLYIEVKRHTAYIHTKERVIETPCGLNTLESEISNRDFLRCHRSFLVNQRHIRQMDKHDFVMNNGDLVPIGSSDAATVRQKFMDWMFSACRSEQTSMPFH